MNTNEVHMLFFKNRQGKTTSTPTLVPPPDDDEHIHDAEKVLSLAILQSQQNDFQELLRLTASKGLTLFDADTFTIIMVNPVTQHTMKTLMRQGTPFDDRHLHLLRVNITGWILKHGQPFLSADLSTDSRFAPGLFAGVPACSAMCVPMQNGGLVCGHILLASNNPNRRFGSGDLELLIKCASVWGAFLNNSQRVAEYFAESIPDDVLISKYAPLGLLGRSHKFKELLRAIDAAAKCDIRVFLEGRSGSGKECVARAIHTLGKRSARRFIAIDCGAIPEHLLESELFGHVKGAFTGAAQARKGLLEEAHGGTLFIDEIENLQYDMQAKLLRVLQEGEVRAIGSDLSRKVDVRIISASQTPAVTLVKEKKLREDLFYRLHVYPIIVPTLNERSDDIPLLAKHFLGTFAAQQGKKAETLHPSLVHFMTHRTWPGNVRELENFVQRMVTLAAQEMTELNHSLLPEEYRMEFRAFPPSRTVRTDTRSLRECVQEVERQVLLETLVANGWNQSEAARTLQVSERTIRYKIGQLHLARG
jgi:transcriptional regulator with GAF, ATPase, and Fis domain